MGVMRKLLELLIAPIRSEDLATELEATLYSQCRVRLPPRVSKGGKKRTFAERVKKARIGGPQSLSILEHYDSLLDVVLSFAGSEELKKKVEAMREVWKQYHDLVSLSKQAHVAISEEEWLSHARRFGTSFTNCFRPEDVTPYIHVFVYHFGYFMEKFDGIEKWAFPCQFGVSLWQWSCCLSTTVYQRSKQKPRPHSEKMP